MAEAIDVILRLFKGEIVTEKTEWYRFRWCPGAFIALYQTASRGGGGQRRDAVGRPAGR